MQSQIKLGRIFGVEIGLHYSWIVIALLIVFSLAGHFRETNSQWGDGVVLITAVATGVLFFAAVTGHQWGLFAVMAVVLATAGIWGTRGSIPRGEGGHDSHY